MKKEIANRVKLGIFISIGFVILVYGVYFIGEKQQLFRSTFRLSSVFKDVGGLQVGNNVRLSGVNIGTVENINIISDTTVRVVYIIDADSRNFIKKNSIASIGSEGFIGNKTLIISPGVGGNPLIENNDEIAASQPIDLDKVIVTLKSTLDNLSSITSDLSGITNNISSGKGIIGSLIMDNSLQNDFASSFTNMKNGSAQFQVLMESANKITGNIESGQGVIGRLLMDSVTARNMDSTIINLRDGTSGLKVLMDKAKGSWLLW